LPLAPLMKLTAAGAPDRLVWRTAAAFALPPFLLKSMTTVPAKLESVSEADAPAVAPPVAPRRPKVDVIHGLRRSDDYFWLRDKASPDVRAYLEAENAYTDALMAPTRPLQETL